MRQTESDVQRGDGPGRGGDGGWIAVPSDDGYATLRSAGNGSRGADGA